MPASPVFDSAARRRCVAVLAAGALLPPVLAGCTTDEEPSEGKSGAARDIAAYDRDRTTSGGSLRWAVDGMPRTLNTFQAEADETTDRIAEAVLPTLFPLDSRARPQRNQDYLDSAEITSREPQQTVVYTLSDKARWSDGKPITAADFHAQWKALSGTESAFWSARNAGYERVHKVEKGENARQVKVTFARPYSDWKSLFSPLYPRSVMGDSKTFNDATRTQLAVAGGPFRIKGGKVDRKDKAVTLERNPHWWGDRAKLETIVLTPVERTKRAKALAQGKVDLAEVDQSDLDALRPTTTSDKPPAVRQQADADASASASPSSSTSATSSPSTSPSPTPDSSTSPKPTASETTADSKDSKAKDEDKKDEAEQEAKKEAEKDTEEPKESEESEESKESKEKSDKAEKAAKAKAKKAREAAEKAAAARRQAAEERRNLAGLTVRRALGPGYTQLALNGSSGPLKDERVRRAIGRALDREDLATSVLRPAGLPGKPLGSHLRAYDQDGYEDASAALGDSGTKAAAAQLAAAGWKGGPALGTHEAGADNEADQGRSGDKDAKPTGSRKSLFSVLTHSSATTHAGLLRQAAHNDARLAKAAGDSDDDEHERLHEAAKASMKRATEADQALSRWTGGLLAAEGGLVRAKQGKKLQLRMVLPAGPEAGQLRATGKRIAYMLEEVGIRADITEVADKTYFEDHIASGDFDMALYSWPVSAYPVTDARPQFAKPVPAPDGSLLIEQNYTRVGTDQIDSLFEQAVTELDDKARAGVLKRIDDRVWAVAGSIPLYQRPELVAVNKKIVNAGAFGFETPRYQDIGYRK